jgi:hypothetical protein
MALDDRDYYREHIARLIAAEDNSGCQSGQFRHLAKQKNRPPELASIGWQIAFGIVAILFVLSLAKQVRPEWFDRSGRGWGGTPGSTPAAAEPAASANQGKPARAPLVI